MTRGSARALVLLAAALWLRTLGDSAPRVRPAPRPPPARGGARLLYQARLDANREPAAVLALLPGIGPARAAAIVAARPLCGLGDLDRVPGVGPSTLRSLADRLAFRDLPGNCEQELRPHGH